MHEQQRQRAAQLLDESGIEWALFSDIDSVRWLTGLNLPAPALVWFDRGSFTLLADEGYAVVAAAFGDNSNCAHVSYVGYTIQQPIDAPGSAGLSPERTGWRQRNDRRSGRDRGEEPAMGFVADAAKGAAGLRTGVA